MLTRRHLLVSSVAAATTFGVTGCAGGGGDARVLKVGSQRGGTKALLLAARALDGAAYAVEWSEFPAAQNLLEAIGSGAIDLGLAGDAPFQFAYQSGSPIKAVGAQRAEPRPEGALAIIVPGTSHLKGAADLRGRRIATTRGSIGHYLILKVLAAQGWASDAVKIVFLSPSNSRAALQTGAIDAWSTWVPYIPAALAEGARILVEGSPYSAGYGFDVANAAAFERKPAIFRDFLDREAKAIAWSRAHLDRYAGVLAKETGLPLPIATATVRANLRQRVPIDAGLIADQRAVLATFVTAGELPGKRPIEEAFVLGG